MVSSRISTGEVSPSPGNEDLSVLCVTYCPHLCCTSVRIDAVFLQQAALWIQAAFYCIVAWDPVAQPTIVKEGKTPHENFAYFTAHRCRLDRVARSR